MTTELGPLPLLTLLNPGRHTLRVLLALAAGLGLSTLGLLYAGMPLWGATALVLAVLVPVGVGKWRDDRRAYGPTVMLLSVLLTAQGVHTLEHLVQWGQYHLLTWTMRQANGLLSPANAEWVHFVWNWSVIVVVVMLLRDGMRNRWMWLLYVVAGLHAAEHTYTFIRYHLVLGELLAQGVENVTAQGLPGIVGRDGLLARSAWTRGTAVGSLPGLTTAVRLDVHFWWNALEMGVLILAGHTYLRRFTAETQSTLSSEEKRFQRRDAEDAEFRGERGRGDKVQRF